MVLDYIPCDVEAFSDFFINHNEVKNKPVDKQDELLFSLLDDRFCKFILTKGKYKGCLCMKKIRKINSIYCHFHSHQEKKCIINNCSNKHKRGYDICNKHLKYKTKINKTNDYDDVYYSSIEEKNETNLFNNIDTGTNNIELNLFIDIKLKDIYKICNGFMLQKYFFEHKSLFLTFENEHSKQLIKYKKFVLTKFIYDIYINFKNMINNFIKKYNINIETLYYLLLLLHNINNKSYIKDVILYKSKFIFNENIYEYIKEEKIKKLYKYIYKLYNTNYVNIFKVFNITQKVPEIENLSYKKHKNNNDYYKYIKDMIKIEYNILNNYYYTCLNIFDIKVKDVDIIRPYKPKLICYNILKLKPEERKKKKRIQKFNIKYNKLKKINEETIMWANKTLKTNIYKENVYNIINEHMKYLDEVIKLHGKDVNFIRNTYRTLYSYLCEGWEFYPRDDNDENSDFKIVYNSDTWKLYGSHEDEEFKKLFKI